MRSTNCISQSGVHSYLGVRNLVEGFLDELLVARYVAAEHGRCLLGLNNTKSKLNCVFKLLKMYLGKQINTKSLYSRSV